MVGHAQARTTRRCWRPASRSTCTRRRDPARQALHASTTTVARDRLQQHGPALVRAELRGVMMLVGPEAVAAHAGRRGPLPVAVPPARPRRSGRAAPAHPLRRQRDAADRRPPIGETSRRSHDTGHNRRPRKSARRLGAPRRRGVPVRRPDDARPSTRAGRVVCVTATKGRGRFPRRRLAVGSRTKPHPRDRACRLPGGSGGPPSTAGWAMPDGGCAGVDDEGSRAVLTSPC